MDWPVLGVKFFATMMVLVIGFNCGMAVGCFYLAWRLWWLGKRLGSLADQLALWVAHTQYFAETGQLLDSIGQVEQDIAHLRQRYAHLQRQLGLFQQLMGIARIGLSMLTYLGFRSPRQRWAASRKLWSRLFQHRPRGERR